MVADTLLYDLLGVSPTATDQEIKKAFQKKARELHPDKNPNDPKATEKFQELNEAYEVLKDPQKRETYDKFGPGGLKESVGMETDLFTHLFGDFGGFGDFGFGRRSKRGRMRTEDIEYPIKVSLEELYNGAELSVRIQRQIICPQCSGSGCCGGKKASKCNVCGGTGQKTSVYRSGNVITQQTGPCNACKGNGEHIPANDRCKHCNGSKIIKENKKIDVHVERGMQDGDTIIMKGKSNELPDCDTGDLIIRIIEKKHTLFMRRNNDLFIKKNITLTEALLGVNISITHLDGRVLVIKDDRSVIQPNAVKLIDREGMPIKGDPFNRGRLFISFNIEFPKKEDITVELARQLEISIPKPDLSPLDTQNDPDVYTVEMKDASLDEFYKSKPSRQKGKKEAYHNDSDDDNNVNGCNPM